MNTATITTVATLLVTAAAVVSAAVMAYKREQFEQERIRKADDERMMRNRKWLDHVDLAGAQPLPALVPVNNGMSVPVRRTMDGRIDVNWVDDYPGMTPCHDYYRRSYDSGYGYGYRQPQRPLYDYGYGYGPGGGYNSQQHQQYINPNMEFTFGNDDELIKRIASRPPSASPIFGINYRVA